MFCNCKLEMLSTFEPSSAVTWINIGRLSAGKYESILASAFSAGVSGENADKSVSKTGRGNSWAPKARVRTNEMTRIGMEAFSNAEEEMRVGAFDSAPPIGVAGRIRLISKKATNARSIALQNEGFAPT